MALAMYRRAQRTPWRKLFKKAGRTALGIYANYRRSQPISLPRRQKTISASITEQRDFSRLYKRRAAPRRVRRRARKAFQRFTYHLDKTQGMVTTKINNFANVATNVTNWKTNAVGSASFTMYGCAYNINQSDPNNDLCRIYYDAYGALPTSANSAGKLRFRSCVMDFQIQNNSANNDCYVEVWHVMARKNGEVSPLTEFANAIDNQLGAGAGVNGSITDIGCYKLTPFDAPGFGTYWFVKQIKKYYLQVAQSFTFQIRDAKNYVINGVQIGDQKSLPYVTEGVIFRVYGAALTSAGEGLEYVSAPSNSDVDISCIKTYHWTKTDLSSDVVGTTVND